MSKELDSQEKYWDRESDEFQSIYTNSKSPFMRLLDRVFRKDMFQRFEFTMGHSEPISGKSVLDVGCGSGEYSLAFAQRGAGEVVGLDISESMLGMCREVAARKGVQDRCGFLHTDLLAYQPGRQFDVTIGIGLFDYISEPLPVLKKMCEVSSGKVIMSFPRLWTWRAPVRRLRLARRGCPVYFYTRGRLAALMQEAGFASYERYTVGKLHCIVAVP